MDDRKKLIITMPDGTEDEVEEVISLQFNDTKKQYVVYTKNETDDAGNVTIYVTEMLQDANGTKFLGVSSDLEWDRIKEALRKLANKE